MTDSALNLTPAPQPAVEVLGVLRDLTAGEGLTGLSAALAPGWTATPMSSPSAAAPSSTSPASPPPPPTAASATCACRPPRSARATAASA